MNPDTQAALRWVFFDMALALNCIANAEGYFVDLSLAWEDTLGFTLEELKSKPFVEFVHPDDRANTIREAGRLLEFGTSTVTFRNRYACKDGTYKLLEWRSLAHDEHYFAVARELGREEL